MPLLAQSERSGCARAASLAVSLVLVGNVFAADFTYVANNGSITITGHIGPGGNAVIPATIDGLPVTSIGDSAFFNLTNLTGVTMPDSVTNIGDQAFLACVGLTNILIGTGVTQISGGGARVMWGTFAGCTNLARVTIPDSVTNITDGILTRGGGLGAFSYCYGLTNVTIGSGVRYLGMGTFSLCRSLKQVSLPDSMRTIADFAFHGCYGLTEANLGHGVTELGPGLGYAFDGCTSLTSVRIPGSVTNIGKYAFADCSSLAGVTIDEGVTSIGFQAFMWCSSLTNITLPASVTTLNDTAFSYCLNLAGIFFRGNAPTLPESPIGVFYGTTNVTVYYLPGTTGWSSTYAGRPTMLWNPELTIDDSNFGVRQNRFGFDIAGTADIPIVVEACPDLASQAWVALQSCTLTNGLLYFSDPQWTNHPARFYRIRSP